MPGLQVRLLLSSHLQEPGPSNIPPIIYIALLLCAPFEEEGVYYFAHVGRCVSRLVHLSIEKSLRSITRELIDQGSSYLVWWLVMTSR